MRNLVKDSPHVLVAFGATAAAVLLGAFFFPRASSPDSKSSMWTFLLFFISWRSVNTR
jgi:hypothetical protein